MKLDTNHAKVLAASVAASQEQFVLTLAATLTGLIAVLTAHGIGTEEQYMKAVEEVLAMGLEEFKKRNGTPAPAWTGPQPVADGEAK